MGPTQFKLNSEACLFPEQKQAVQDYRSLYFQSVRRIHQLTSIQNILFDAAQTLNSQQIKNIMHKCQEEQLIMKRIIQQKTRQNDVLATQLQKLKLLKNQRQAYSYKKQQVQSKRNEVSKHQLQLLKQELRILRKQLQNQKQLNQKYQLNLKEQINTKVQAQRDNPSENDNDGFMRLKGIIETQLLQISELRSLLKSQQQKLALNQYRLLEVQRHKQNLKQLYDLQLQSKEKIIQTSRKELSKKQTELSHLKTFKQKLVQLRYQNQDLRQKIQKITHQLEIKDRLNQKQKNILRKLQITVNKSESSQKQLYSELKLKQIQIQTLQYSLKQLSIQTQWFRQVIQQLKGQYINCQLQKENILHKYSKQNKSSMISRNTNLSQSKLNKSNSTLSTVSFTPSSQNSSKAVFQPKFVQKQRNQFLQIKNSGYLSCKGNLNGLKRSFYKNRDTRKPSEQKLRIKPFQI